MENNVLSHREFKKRMDRTKDIFQSLAEQAGSSLDKIVVITEKITYAKRLFISKKSFQLKYKSFATISRYTTKCELMPFFHFCIIGTKSKNR